jgi:O-methyltransferase involved in polyketide biosynthesis
MQSNPSPEQPNPIENTRQTSGEPGTRDFSTISPSAYSLLLMKGLTPIPYARQAAELLLASRPDVADRLASFDTENRPPLFWARLLHFENRYWTIDQLMQSLPITNILELSSGFSFRGLALSRENPVYYIDTDLPDLIAIKEQFVAAFTRTAEAAAASSPEAAAASSPNLAGSAINGPGPSTSSNTPGPAGHYELLPLNVLDAPAFNAIVDRFPPGPLLIVNEGLLVYLEPAEKEALCQTIRSILERRGGYWITGDIYIQKDIDPALIDRNDSFHQFLQQHRIEEKKFRDFESATEFFTRMGFIVDREAVTDVSKLSAWPRLLAAITPEIQKKLSHSPKMHATWRLRVAPTPPSGS